MKKQGETDTCGSMCVVLSESAEGQVLNVRMNSVVRPSMVHPHESHKWKVRSSNSHALFNKSFCVDIHEIKKSSFP